MNDLTGDVLHQLHLKGHGPCPTPSETAAVLQKAMTEFKINTICKAACFLGQLALESNEFLQLVEGASGEAYEGRGDLGNVSSGDGRKYKGRGYIQLTGRHNYAVAGQALSVDLYGKPELASVPEIAARIAGWYWFSHGLSMLAESMKVKEITKRINGGYNNLEERIAYTNLALKALQPEGPWRLA